VAFVEIVSVLGAHTDWEIPRRSIRIAGIKCRSGVINPVHARNMVVKIK
jgi:hypothetical protein